MALERRDHRVDIGPAGRNIFISRDKQLQSRQAKRIKVLMRLVMVLVGLVVATLTALVIFGGIQTISRVCEKLVPFMAAFYILGCAAILVYNRDCLWLTVTTICRLAFTPGAAAGGLTGGGIMLAMRYGIARGLFSNESGMGSAPIVAAAAQTRNPVRQALVSSSGTFWDTVVVCLMTGLVLVSSILKNPAIDKGSMWRKVFWKFKIFALRQAGKRMAKTTKIRKNMVGRKLVF